MTGKLAELREEIQVARMMLGAAEPEDKLFRIDECLERALRLVDELQRGEGG